jgi:hypothetical protein
MHLTTVFNKRRKSIGIHNILDALRSWVQLPPGPFLSVVQLRYYFEFNLDNCRTILPAMHIEDT